MTSAHGNKSLLLVLLVCFFVFSSLLCTFLSQRRARLSLYEKEYKSELTSLKEKNKELVAEGKVWSEERIEEGLEEGLAGRSEIENETF